MIELREAAKRMAAGLESGDLDVYVEALNTSCRNLYRLHPSCDSEAHRRYFDALDESILGGKTCGAGGGGFMIVYTRSGRRRDCVRRAQEMGATVWPLNIDFTGVTAWEQEPTSSANIEFYRKLASE